MDRLDYGLIRRHPKFFGGFSDVTCLINAIQRQTGLVTFHSPFAGSTWTSFSTQHFRALVMEGEAPLLRNPTGPAQVHPAPRGRGRDRRGRLHPAHPGARGGMSERPQVQGAAGSA